MRTGSKSLALFLIGVLTVIPALAADTQDSHVADQAAIEKALIERSSEDDANREAIVELLRRPEVRELAGKLKLDLQHAETAVATLDGDELVELASMAREAESGLSGGEKITISTTTIIIGLLVLILIIVAI